MIGEVTNLADRTFALVDGNDSIYVQLNQVIVSIYTVVK